MTGLEPATTGSTIRGSNQLSYTHRNGAGMLSPGGVGVKAWREARRAVYSPMSGAMMLR